MRKHAGDKSLPGPLASQVRNLVSYLPRRVLEVRGPAAGTLFSELPDRSESWRPICAIAGGAPDRSDFLRRGSRGVIDVILSVFIELAHKLVIGGCGPG